MIEQNKKRVPLNKDVVLLIRGLIIGKVLTLAVVGGLLWWLKPSLWAYSSTASSLNQDVDTTSATSPSFQTIADVPIGSFNYGGSTAWVPIRQVVDSQIQNARPELQLRYVNPTNGNPSSSSGIRLLLNGQLDVAQSSRPLKDEEYAVAQQRGFTLEQRPVAIDGMAVVVNPSLQVPGLTVDQLRQIYLGQILNWSQVGGPNLPIIPFSLRPEDTDTTVFATASQVQQSFGSNVRYVRSTTEALRKVGSIPGSLYYASARGVVPQCSVKPLPLGNTSNQLVAPYREPLVLPEQCPRQRNQLNTEALKNGSYPMIGNLFVVIKQNQGREQWVGEVYAKALLTDQGQKAIEQAGFVSLR